MKKREATSNPQQEPGIANQADDLVERVKPIADFFSDALEAFESSGIVEAIGKALPWTTILGKAVAEAVPPIKFVTTILSQVLKEPSPEALAYVAFTVAYQRSVEQALPHVLQGLSDTTTKTAREASRESLRALRRGPAPVPISEIGFETALEQPFVQQADEYLRTFSAALGLDQAHTTSLVVNVHTRFLLNLKLLLADERTYKKFEPLSRLLELGGTSEGQSYRALLDHANAQRSAFEDAPVLGSEPFSASSVYVDTDCGVLLWRSFAEARTDERGDVRRPIDPFDPAHGGRHPLLGTVLTYFKDARFKDAVVIQGVAGAGKSTFTLRLCAELIREGLVPIRVRLRDVVFDRHAREAIPRAVLLPETTKSPSESLFRGGSIFNHSLRFGEATISPYVLILDGWDEISVSSNEGFRRRVAEFLDQVRSEYLTNRNIPVRLVLTGRPSADVTTENSGFFHSDTPILTMRPFSPTQLGAYLGALHRVLAAPDDKESRWPSVGDRWAPPDPRQIRAVVDQYKVASETDRIESRIGSSRTSTHHLEVLGLPLLTLLTARLLGRGDIDHTRLISSKTELFRKLVDQTTVRGGKARDDLTDDFDNPTRQRFSGQELRELLHKTALAITVFGQERISFDDLARCVAIVENKTQPVRMQREADIGSDEFPILKLVISFFFRGGRHDLGAEFVHKAFREYLCAEAIVTILRRHGQRLRGSPMPREETWEDFSERDPRRDLLLDLGPPLSAHWLTAEVLEHIDNLLEFEFSQGPSPGERAGSGDDVLQLWTRTRDALNDIWEYWALGDHMRPQPHGTLDGTVYHRSYAESLAGRLYSRSVAPGVLRWPVRTSTIDAHLGDALFRLNAWLHARLLRATGWPGPKQCEELPRMRPYQSRWSHQGREYVCFRPGGDQDHSYLRNYTARINSAGWHRGVAFANEVDASCVDFRSAEMMAMPLERARLVDANLQGARLEGAVAWQADLSRATLRGASMVHMDLRNATLASADLSFVNMRYSVLEAANLDCSLLIGSDLRSTILHETSFRHSDLSRARLDQAIIVGAIFSGAILEDVNFTGVDLSHCTIDDARRATIADTDRQT